MPVFDINIPIAVNADGTVEVGPATVAEPKYKVKIHSGPAPAVTAREVARRLKAGWR